MSDIFSTWIRLQEETLRVQRSQIDAAQKMMNVSGNAIKLQKSMAEANKAGLGAWNAMLRFWGGAT